MNTLGWAVVAMVAFFLHEGVVTAALVRRLGRRSAAALRYLCLALLLLAVTFAGPAVLARVVSVLAPAEPAVTPFVPRGDRFLAGALVAQRPVFPFPEVPSPGEISRWQTRVLDSLRTDVGIGVEMVPPSVPVRVLGSERVGDLTRTMVVFRTWDGAEIPAYVHGPSTAGGARPALLVIPGHGAGIVATSGRVADYQHATALELARAGYVTLTPELRGFGMLGGSTGPNHRAVALTAIEAGTSYKAVTVKDLGFALSALASWPGVDGNRLGVVGTSLGGELAVLLGAVDSRVRAVLSHSYGGLLGPATVDVEAIDEEEQTPHGCHTVPGSNRILLQEDWARLVAPKPLLVVRGDDNTPQQFGAFVLAVRRAYEGRGAVDRFAAVREPGGHEFYLEPSLRFLKQWL